MNSFFRYRQLVQIIKTNFLELVREPGVLFWGILFPILMSVGLGIAFTQKVNVVRKVAVIEDKAITNGQKDSISLKEYFQQRSAATKDTVVGGIGGYTYTERNIKMGNNTFIFLRTDWEKAMVWLKQGYVNVIMSVKNGKAEYHFDPANSDAKLSYILLSGSNSSQSSRAGDAQIKPLTLSGTRYIDFLIPGLIAMGVMMSCMWGLTYTIIERRSKKLLRRMVATPMKKSHFLIGLIAVRVAMNFIESFLLFIFAAWAFDIRIQGSLPALAAIFISGNIAFAGIAVFMSSRTSKTEIGNGLINAVVMPMMILSGVFFSYHNFPDWAVTVIQKMPLTMIADGMRSIFIEGGGFAEVGFSSLILTIIGVVFFATGLKMFKWH
jgi:ABC-2 type transport system permease protein